MPLKQVRFDFGDRVALVTGAASGIGAGMAVGLGTNTTWEMSIAI